MAELTFEMSHGAAISHLREEVSGTARYETGRLITPESPAFFGAVRGVMCDVDYVAALYDGWEGGDRRRIATSTKTARFLREVFAPATENDAYDRFAEHLYELYRVGTVHVRAPKIVTSAGQVCSTPALTWALTFARREVGHIQNRTYSFQHLVPLEVSKNVGNYATATMLPVSIAALFDDFLSACEFYAIRLEDEEASGGADLLTRWRSVANELCRPESNRHLRW